MATFRRYSRPSDRNLGYFAGEQMRPVRPTEGPHAGYTLVTACGPQAKRLLKRDGWVEVDETGPVVTEETGPAEVTNPTTLLGVIGTGTLADLDRLLCEQSLIVLSDQPKLLEAIALEKAGRNRKGAVKLLKSYLLDDPKPATPETVTEAPAEAEPLATPSGDVEDRAVEDAPDAPQPTGLGVEAAGSVLVQPAIGRNVQRPKL